MNNNHRHTPIKSPFVEKLGTKKFSYNFSLAVLVFIFIVSLVPATTGSAQSAPAFIREIRSLESERTGIQNPAGLAISTRGGGFHVVEAANNVVKLDNHWHRASEARLASLISEPINISFDDKFNRLLIFNAQSNQLVSVSADGNGDLDPNTVARYNAKKFGVLQASGITMDPQSGALFILDSAASAVVRVDPDATGSFDNGNVSQLGLQLGNSTGLRGIAFDPMSGNLHVLSVAQKKLYELNANGALLAFRDLSEFGLQNPQSITFASSGDSTDDPAQMSLYVADSGTAAKTASSTPTSGQIMELSLVQPEALPAGTTLLSATLVRTFDTSNKAWNPSSPDPSGIDYWPLTGGFILVDSEVDEMSNYFTGKNVYMSTLSGSLTGACSTTTLSRSGWSNEPTGVAVNPDKNTIFVSDDDKFKVFEVSFGADGQYCTSDDTVTSVATTVDTEDVAYGNNTVFIAGGSDAEVVMFNLGPDGKLGGGDDGPTTHFDTAILGFSDLEGIDYNDDTGTLYIVSTSSNDKYLGEVTTTGTLLHAYDLSLMGTASNIRSSVVYAPASQNPAVKNIYIVSRGVDNNTSSTENDGKAWEIALSAPAPTATNTNTPTPTNTPTAGPSPTPTNTPTNTPTFTPTQPASNNPLYASFGSNGTVGGVAFADEDILRFNGTSWSVYFDGSNVGLSAADVVGVDVLDPNTILMSLDRAVTLGSLSVTAHDIVKFQATSLGLNTTSGAFSMYFRGADVGLDTSSENIDAIDTLPDGRVLISTNGNPSVVTNAKDEDVVAFTPAVLGAPTSGSWAMYLKGSNVGLSDSSTEDTDAVDLFNGNLYLSTSGAYSVTGSTGAGEDVFVCTPSGSGSSTTCSYSSSLYFDGSTWGVAGNNLDGFDVLSLGPIPTSTPTNTPTDTATPTNTFTATATFTATNTPTIGPSPTPTNTPTVTNTPTNTSIPTDTPTPTATNTPGPTNTPTPTSAITDLIFKDGFESGNLSAWSASITNNGNLSASPNAALHGSFGLQASISSTTAMYVRDDSPLAEPRYRARFYFNPNSIAMNSGDYTYLLQGHDGTGKAILFIQFARSSTGYQIRIRAYDTGLASYTNSTYVVLSNAMHSIEVDWANDGHVSWWLDGTQQTGLTGINNSTQTMESIRLGAPYMAGTGLSGSYYIDDFESHKQSVIGP